MPKQGNVKPNRDPNRIAKIESITDRKKYNVDTRQHEVERIASNSSVNSDARIVIKLINQ